MCFLRLNLIIIIIMDIFSCSMVGLTGTVEVLVCCLWRRIVDIHDSGMSIPLSLFGVFGWSSIWIASFTRRVYQCQQIVLNKMTNHRSTTSKAICNA